MNNNWNQFYSPLCSLNSFYADGFGAGRTIELADAAAGAEAGVDAGDFEAVFFGGDDGFLGTLAEAGIAWDGFGLGEAGQAVELGPTVAESALVGEVEQRDGAGIADGGAAVTVGATVA